MKVKVRLVDRNATISVNGVELTGEKVLETEMSDNVKALLNAGLIFVEVVKENKENLKKGTKEVISL